MSALFDLTGKTAIVTGGTSGIGLAIAAAYAAHGARVAVWGRSASPEKVPAGLEHLQPDSLVCVPCDVAEEDSVVRAFAQTVEALGPVDVVVANAGISPGRVSFADYPTEVWRDTLATNLDGMFFTLRSAAKHMVQVGNGGSLIAVGSLVVDAGFPQRESYAASKTGVLGLVRSIAVEFARHGIRANTILPGWIETPMMDEVVNGGHAKRAGVSKAVLTRVPMRRFGKPEDLAGIAVYLASDASRYHSGDAIRIDGGYSVM